MEYEADERAEAEARENAALDAFIEQLHADNVADLSHGNTEHDVDVAEEPLDQDQSDGLPPYLVADSDGPLGRPKTDALQHPYVRVVHSNGLHHIAMVSCACRNDVSDGLALDLVSIRLIPASFQKIRTLFTAQMLDHFRLCNLELKASAYQFYQLLRRITSPTAPSQVLNLYNELRRMSRLWRWMKRLKWNGFGHSGRNPNTVTPGELAVYCPTCPQPGVNIPDNWQDLPDQWLYRRMFVADGNFKADHVRQPKSKGDYWLSEGGGMDPPYEKYEAFLRSAIEKPTVSALPDSPQAELTVAELFLAGTM